ncbi:hypothetical protein NSA27_00550 [Clostridium tepidum]|nr:hypothetical protein [Clostridium tepidum]MCR1933193.1 hypothetical protein [Clostridium tepidum]
MGAGIVGITTSLLLKKEGFKVALIDAEKSWDCHYHSSRFSYKGDIIEGPNINKLNHYKESPNRIDLNIYNIITMTLKLRLRSYF